MYESDQDLDRADWQHEVKRDKHLDRIAELESENKLYEDALANYEQRVAGLEVESGIYSASLMAAEQKIVKLEAERDRLRDAVRECGKRFAEYGDHAYQALCRAALEGE